MAVEVEVGLLLSQYARFVWSRERIRTYIAFSLLEAPFLDVDGSDCAAVCDVDVVRSHSHVGSIDEM